MQCSAFLYFPAVNIEFSLFISRHFFSFLCVYFFWYMRVPRALPSFYNHLLFSEHFEELQTVLLIQVELIINNASLTYVYPNTIETCLTPNYLLFDRQVLYSPNTAWTVFRNLTVLSRTADKINRINNHFRDRWIHEYVVNLRETQRAL